MHPAATAVRRGNGLGVTERSIDDRISMSILSSEGDEEATGTERRHKQESPTDNGAEAIYMSPKAVGRHHRALSGEKIDAAVGLSVRQPSRCTRVVGVTGSVHDLETHGNTDYEATILDVRAQLNPSYHQLAGVSGTHGWDKVRQMLPRRSACSGDDAKKTTTFADVLSQVSLLTTAVEAIDRDDAAALISALSAGHGTGNTCRLNEMIVSPEAGGGRRCDLLYYAVNANRTEAALALVTLGGADLVLHSQTSNAITMSTETCLHAAVVHGNDRVVRVLLEAAGADKAAERFALKEMVTVDGDERLSVSALHLAAMYGHVTLIDYLVCERYIPVDTPCSTRATATYLAARRGEAGAVRRLLALGAKTDIADRTQMTFLHYAILSGQNDMVKLCLQSCIMSSCIELWRRSNPLLLAVYQEKYDIVTTLLEAEDLRILMNVPTRTFGHTALHVSCSSGKDADATICRALLEAGADALACNKHGETPFATAILHRKVSSMVTMARHFTPPRRRYFQTVSANGDTVWDYALRGVSSNSSTASGAGAESGREVLAALLEIALYACRAEGDFADAGEEIDLSAFVALENESQLTTPLHIAVKKSNVEDIQLLLKYMSAAAVDANGDTFMHVAAREGREDALRCFAIDQSTVNRMNNAGETVLHSACAARQWASARLLLPLADVSATNNRGQTALHELCKNCSPSAYALLRDVVRKTTDDAWEKLSLRDNGGRTPLHLLVARDLQESTEMLIRLFFRPYDSPVPCNVADSDGDTPLHVAVSHGRVKNLVAMLTVFGSGADVNSMNCFGRTPLHIAADIGMAEVVETLLVHGADLTLRDKLGDTPMHTIVRRAGQVPSQTDKWKAMLMEILRHSHHQESLRSLYREGLKSETINDMRTNAIVLLRMLTNSDGLTPLFFAAQVGCKELLRLMLTLDGVFRLTELPGHEASDDSAYYDVTDLVPDTVRQQPPISVEEKDAIPLKGLAEQDKAPLTQQEIMQFSDEPLSPTKRPNSTAIRRRTQRQQKQYQQVTGSAWRRRQRDGLGAGSRSLVEFILEDVGSRSHLLDVTPLDELTADYWAPYKVVYLALMIFHIVAMGMFSWVSLDALNGARALLDCKVNRTSLPGNASSETTSGIPSLASISAVMIWPFLIIVFNIVSLVGYVRRKYDCRGLAADARRSLSYVRDTQAPMFWILGVAFSWVSALWYALHLDGHCAQDYALCVALITGWLYTIHFTQGIRSVHHFALVLGRILMRDIWQFGIIFVFVLLGYSLGFHSMTFSMPKQSETYDRYGITVFKVFSWGAGMGDFYQETDQQYRESGKNKEFVEAVFVTYVIALNIILLNMLIAVMNDSYAAVRESSEATWRLGSLRRAIAFERRYSRLARLMRRWRQADVVLETTRSPPRLFLRLQAKGSGGAGNDTEVDTSSEFGSFRSSIGGRNLGRAELDALTQSVLASIKQSLVNGALTDENVTASPKDANPSAECEDSSKPKFLSAYLDRSTTVLSRATSTVGNSLV